MHVTPSLPSSRVSVVCISLAMSGSSSLLFDDLHLFVLSNFNVFHGYDNQIADLAAMLLRNNEALVLHFAEFCKNINLDSTSGAGS
jgi:hypothetical protein